jgi:Protein of unknown function (DUF3300)
MDSPIELRAANMHYFLRTIAKDPRQTPSENSNQTAKELPRKLGAKGRRTAIFALGFLVFASGSLAAQQPYGAYGDPNAQPQYAQPGQPYGQPQYAQPQPQQPQYAQPQYAAPQQYPAQPQYAQPGQPYGQPQYAQPQQPQYAQPQYGAQEQYPAQPQYDADQQPYAAPGYPSEPDLSAPPSAPVQSLSAEQLEQMLAPIALYPDALLAQILAAATYPAQVAAADQWLAQMRAQGYGDANQIAAGAMQQTSWDPSIKALTAFPDVLDMLNHNLEWTTALGNAYYNQPQDVMQTVQVLRQRAEQAGNLQPTPQEDVTDNQGYIDIAPPNPQVVYVPTYNPWDVYGAPISPYPGFSLFGALGNFFGGLPVQYGLSFALGAFEHTPFGLLAWGLDWLAHSIMFDHGAWNSRSTTLADWGLPHGGPRAFPGWHAPARGPGYGPGTFNRSYGGSYAANQRGNWNGGASRPGNYIRPAIGNPYNPQSSAMNRGPVQGVRGAQSYQPRQDNFNRGADAMNRGYQPNVNAYARPANPAYTHPAIPGVQAYNRAAAQPAYAYRPQTYPNRQQAYAARPAAPAFANPGYGYANRPTNGYSVNGYSGQAYASRPGNSYSTSRAPQFDSRAYSSRSYQTYGNLSRNEFGGSSGFSEKEPKYSAPKYSYKAPKSFGHEKAPKAPRMSHSSGGGGGHHHFL